MFTSKKKQQSKVLYQIKGEERGQIQAFNAMAALSSASVTQLLSTIMEREGISTQEADGVVFDQQSLSFIQK